MAEPTGLPLELTAPAMQRLARKGVAEPLDPAECARLCECVLHHVDALLARRRIPKVADGVAGGIASGKPRPAPR